MPDLINSILLSSGTVVRIPIFPEGEAKTLPAAANIYTRSGGILSEVHGTTASGLPNYMAVSTEDMLELARIFYDVDATGVNYSAWSVGQHNVQFLMWTTDENGNYILKNPFSYSSSAHVVNPNYRTFPSQYDTLFYWNNINKDGENFYTEAAKVNSYVANALINVREGGVWSVDIATRSKLTMPLIGGENLSVQNVLNRVSRYKQEYPNSDVAISVYDPESNTDPYIIDDPADFGGGTGSHEDPDEIEKATIPPLPTLSAVDTGLVTLYTATEGQLQALGGYLWANAFDLETNFVKLFSNPMDCLIGLSIVPVTPSIAGAQNVKFGNITTPIGLQKLSSQYVEVDCGTINCKEYIGSFLDYSPYVNISIYLPYVGYRELSPDDVMNDTIHVVYHIDVLSGGCCAMIETGKKGLLYSFNGSCIANVPITAINYSGAIQNAVSAVGAGLTMAAGIATGAAPLTAMGATSMLGNAANTAVNSKPTIQRSGSMGGAAGLMSLQHPLLIITRPRQSVPANLNKFVGLTTNVTMNLATVKGYTVVEHVHLAGIPAMQEEKEELARLLREGVIF